MSREKLFLKNGIGHGYKLGLLALLYIEHMKNPAHHEARGCAGFGKFTRLTRRCNLLDTSGTFRLAPINARVLFLGAISERDLQDGQHRPDRPPSYG